jgi:hypothetical protein
MAGKTDVPDSMIDGLKGLIGPIAEIQAAPDADIAFLDKLLKAVLLRIHAATGPSGGQPGAGGPPPPPGPAAGGGGPGGPPPGMGMPGGPPGGQPANGQMQSLGAPQAPGGPMTPGGVSAPMGLPEEEVRRVLATQAGA